MHLIALGIAFGLGLLRMSSAAGGETFRLTLEDESGDIQLEDGSGFILREDAP